APAPRAVGRLGTRRGRGARRAPRVPAVLVETRRRRRARAREGAVSHARAAARALRPRRPRHERPGGRARGGAGRSHCRDRRRAGAALDPPCASGQHRAREAVAGARGRDAAACERARHARRVRGAVTPRRGMSHMQRTWFVIAVASVLWAAGLTAQEPTPAPRTRRPPRAFVLADDNRGRIGVVVRTQPDSEADKFGAKLEGVTPGGPAAKAGLKVGDIITRFNGTVLAGL